MQELMREKKMRFAHGPMEGKKLAVARGREHEGPTLLTPKDGKIFRGAQTTMIEGISSFLGPLGRGINSGKIEDPKIIDNFSTFEILSSANASEREPHIWDHIYMTPGSFYSFAIKTEDEKVMISLGTTLEGRKGITTLTISNMRGNVLAHLSHNPGEKTLSFYIPEHEKENRHFA
jgi:hypothetical protein